MAARARIPEGPMRRVWKVHGMLILGDVGLPSLTSAPNYRTQNAESTTMVGFETMWIFMGTPLTLDLPFMIYILLPDPIYYTTVIPRALVKKVMQDFYHQQYIPGFTAALLLKAG